MPRFGRRRAAQEYSYLLTTCPLCGTRVVGQHIVLKPPTAGVRILNVDGGGPRGVAGAHGGPVSGVVRFTFETFAGICGTEFTPKSAFEVCRRLVAELTA